MPAPASAPALNAAWKDERIGRPTNRSSARPCALADTLIAPNPAPKTTSAAARAGRSVASDASRSAMLPPTSAARVTARLPIRSPNQPASGIARRAPSDIARSATPRLAVVSCAWCCTDGIRAAHEPIMRPSARNTSVSAMRVPRIRRTPPRRRLRGMRRAAPRTPTRL